MISIHLKFNFTCGELSNSHEDAKKTRSARQRHRRGERFIKNWCVRGVWRV